MAAQFWTSIAPLLHDGQASEAPLEQPFSHPSDGFITRNSANAFRPKITSRIDQEEREVLIDHGRSNGKYKTIEAEKAGPLFRRRGWW